MIQLRMKLKIVRGKKVSKIKPDKNMYKQFKYALCTEKIEKTKRLICSTYLP